MRILFLLTTIVLSLSTAHANIVGSDLQSFNPTPDALDFVTVESARTLSPGVLVLGGFVDQAFNSLPPAIDLNDTKFSVTDRVLSSDFHVGIGLLNNWDAAFSVSNVLDAKVDSVQLANYFVQRGMTDYRLNTKYHLSGSGPQGWAISATAEAPSAQNDAFYGSSSSSAYSLELIAADIVGHLRWALNAGVHVRPAGATLASAPYEPVGNEGILSGALAYHFAQAWTVVTEVYAARPFSGTTNFTVKELTAVEPLLGLKYGGWKNVIADIGVTTQLMRGTSSPDARIYAGLNWTPGRLWGETPHAATTHESEKHPVVAQKEAEPAPLPVATPEPEAVAQSNADDTSVFDRATSAPVEKFVVNGVNFDSGSSVVPATFYPYLAKLAEYLKKGSAVSRLTIEGHCDSAGNPQFNMVLSEKRAQAVKAILVNQYKVQESLITANGLGDTKPVANNLTEQGRAQNRRVEFKIER